MYLCTEDEQLFLHIKTLLQSSRNSARLLEVDGTKFSRGEHVLSVGSAYFLTNLFISINYMFAAFSLFLVGSFGRGL